MPIFVFPFYTLSDISIFETSIVRILPTFTCVSMQVTIMAAFCSDNWWQTHCLPRMTKNKRFEKIKRERESFKLIVNKFLFSFGLQYVVS